MGDGDRLRLQQLLAQDRATFFAQADAVLAECNHPDRSNYLRALVSADQLIAYLESRSEQGPDALAGVVRAARHLLPTVDLKLARHLCDHRTLMDRGKLITLLGVVERVSHPRRVSATLARLLEDPDPMVRSKAALLVEFDDAAAMPGAASDPRVMANVVEAMWQTSNPKNTEAFLRAARSLFPRVAGNAVVGLYRTGHACAVSRIIDMAHHELAGFRRTAAWVMGETNDAQFVPLLTEMLAREQGPVRANVLRSLARLRRAGRARETGEVEAVLS